MITPAMVMVGAGVLGLCLGSFLNVCIYRLPRQRSIAYPASRCPRCHRSLSWFDNVPLVSWLILRGRCRQCREPISWQYPIVEAATAILFVLVAAMTPLSVLLAARLVFTAALIVLFVIDLEHQLLPNVITLPGTVIGFVFSLAAPPGPIDSVLGIILGGGILYAIAAGYYLLRKEEGMGMGDVKMLAMIGAFLGWRAVFLTLILSSFTGAVVGVAMMASQRGGLRYALPFGTFLAIAALVAMLVGEPLLDWYFSLYPPL